MRNGEMDITLMVFNPDEIKRTSEGITLPKPYKLVNVILKTDWVNMAIEEQLTSMEQGEPFALRMYDEAHPEKAPYYACDILSAPCHFSGFITGGEN